MQTTIQYERIKSWDAKGVPFSTYMYVPEEHPVLKTVFHEREDEGHVFKVLHHIVDLTVNYANWAFHSNVRS